MSTDTKNGRRPAPKNSLKIKVASAVATRDWPRVAKAYEQYGHYLELTGDDGTAEAPVEITWPHKEED